MQCVPRQSQGTRVSKMFTTVGLRAKTAAPRGILFLALSRQPARLWERGMCCSLFVAAVPGGRGVTARQVSGYKETTL